MKSIELKELRADVLAELEVIQKTAEAEENRDLTEDENTQVDALLAKADVFSTKIKRAEKLESQLREAAKISGSDVQKVEPSKEARNWSLFKAINEVRNGGGLTGLEAEMHQEAEKENRGALSGVGIPSFMTEKRAIDQAVSAIAPSVTGVYADSLQENGVFSQVGVTDLGNMAADTVIPVAGGSTVAWSGEVTTVSNSGADFGKVTLTPKRLSGVANLSNVILAQNGAAAEAAVMRDLARNVAVQMDAAMFGSTSVINAPGAIAATTGVLTFTEAAAADLASDMLEAIQTIANDHGLTGIEKFVNSYELYSGIKSAAQVSSTSPLWLDGKIDGYDSFFSSAPASVAGTSGDGMFGDFSRVYMASFGPTNILIDPYTNAADNEVRIVLNQHYDFGVASGASFVKYTSLV